MDYESVFLFDFESIRIHSPTAMTWHGGQDYRPGRPAGSPLHLKLGPFVCPPSWSPPPPLSSPPSFPSYSSCWHCRGPTFGCFSLVDSLTHSRLSQSLQELSSNLAQQQQAGEWRTKPACMHWKLAVKSRHVVSVGVKSCLEALFNVVIHALLCDLM